MRGGEGLVGAGRGERGGGLDGQAGQGRAGRGGGGGVQVCWEHLKCVPKSCKRFGVKNTRE